MAVDLNQTMSAQAVYPVNSTGSPTPTGGAVDPLQVKPIGSTNIFTNQVAVTTTATLVCAARSGRVKVTISSTSAVVFYVGPSGVTAANGFYVAAAAGAAVTIDTAAAVYAVGAAAVTLTYVETYNV